MSIGNEVIAFLNDFKAKLGIWGVIFGGRPKNLQTLLDLEITPAYRLEVLKELKKEDYSDGPLKDILYGESSMWVFGKIVKGEEVYIKITLGLHGSKVICISFHISEHPMNYPLKVKHEKSDNREGDAQA